MSGPDPAVREGAADRRRHLVAVLLCLAGGGLALYSATRVWAVEVVLRGGGLSDLRSPSTGADGSRWLPALAVVGLAGAGALLATRGTLRRLVGGVLVAAGLATAVLAFVVAVGWWPAVCALGGVAVGIGGGLALRHGHRWPAMGARFERRPARAARSGAAHAEAGSGPGGGAVPGGGAAQPRGADPTRDAWEALDRGEDPTT